MAEDVAPSAPEMKISEEVMIQMINVHKWYGQFHVLKDIDLTVHKGERIVICGPSGSGKSTLIRCINRLEEHQRGQIIVEGTELTSDLKHIEQIRREVGMVFPGLVCLKWLAIIASKVSLAEWKGRIGCQHGYLLTVTAALPVITSGLGLSASESKSNQRPQIFSSPFPFRAAHRSLQPLERPRPPDGFLTV